MKKLLFLVLIVGCEKTIEPEDTICSNCITGYVRDSEGNALNDAAIILTYDHYNLHNEEMPRLNISSLSITVDITIKTHVLLWIEDMCGDTVNILADEVFEIGSYTIIWDTFDSNGNQVVDGNYFYYLRADILIISGEFMFQQYDWSYLEMNDGKLGNTVQDTFYTSNYHAMTELDGYFSIPLDCLAFDSGEHIIKDDLGNVIGTWAIPYKTKLWIVHEGHNTFSTDFYDVDAEKGVYIEVNAP